HEPQRIEARLREPRGPVRRGIRGGHALRTALPGGDGMEAVSPDIVVIETLGSHGRLHARDRVALTPEKQQVTIGRSALADVVLDDQYAAPLHASIEVAP